MSRKRERKENKLDEPRKKARKSNNEPNHGNNVDQATDSKSHLFDIPELVENIMKYLITNPKMILRIATVSKRHNRIVYSKALWTRLGFTNKISRKDVIDPPVLKRLLIGLRTQHMEQKYARESAILRANKWRAKPMGDLLNLDPEEEWPLLGEEDFNWFLSQRTYTQEAIFTLLTILRSFSGFDSFLSTEEFFKMVFMSVGDITPEMESHRSIPDNGFGRRVVLYPEMHPDHFNGYHTLMRVEKRIMFDIFTRQYSIQKKIISPDKSVVFLLGQSDFKSIHYISIDEKTKTIESCGDLIVSALDPHSWETDRYFSEFDDDVMYNISHFLSKFVFGLDEVDEDLASIEFENMSATEITGNPSIAFVPVKSRSVPQYYWENIPIYQNAP